MNNRRLVIILCALALLPQCGRNKSTVRSGASTPAEARYRVLTFRYGHSSIAGWCGELTHMQLSKAPLKIKNVLWDNTSGIETTLDVVNNDVMSEAFRPKEADLITLYRRILTSEYDTAFSDRTLPDTTAWTI